MRALLDILDDERRLVHQIGQLDAKERHCKSDPTERFRIYLQRDGYRNDLDRVRGELRDYIEEILELIRESNS